MKAQFAPESGLSVQNLNVGFDRPLIQNLNLDLKVGERIIIYGANGCGKSTLLSSLVKTSLQQKGLVRWDLPLENILFVHQQTVFHSQTPDDVENYLLNILLYKKPLTRPSSEEFSKIKRVLEKLHLPNLPLRHLSGGQRQKLKLARGLLLESQALLLDEPFNAIDQRSTREIMTWLNEVKTSTLQILVLHDFEQIEKLKSRVLWIQPEGWELLEFEDWFRKVDNQIHRWIHQTSSTIEISK